MPDSEELTAAGTLCCLHCRGSLTPVTLGLHCPECGRTYPLVAGIPILVAEPVEYLRSEVALLNRAARDAKRRRAMLDKSGQDPGLTKTSIDRHRDVNDAELARVTTFLKLMDPVARLIEAEPPAESKAARRSGWVFDSLLPYLLRDWTATPELQAANALIGAALEQAFPDSRDILVALAGCGAGGLLAEISPEFGHVLGFDLTLPVLVAARHLLDGESIELMLPRAINEHGRIALSNRNPSMPRRMLLAMDAFDTGFADGAVDCVITSFLIDLIPDPRKLADEIHRMLRPNGVWINYGPSGPLRALWRFDQSEGAAFFGGHGFRVVRADAHRATYLDLSRDCPTWSFQNHICYLTLMRKTGQSEEKQRVAPDLAGLPQIIPEHFPAAILVRRERLDEEGKQTLQLRHERKPGVTETLDIGADTAEIIKLVDGRKTVQEIATKLSQTGGPPVEETVAAFGRYFGMGLLSWRVQGDKPFS